MMKLFLLAVVTGLASGYVAPKAFVTRPSTQLYEEFGLGIGEDTYENMPDYLKGEANYKQWVNRIDEKSFINRQYNVIGRVRELNLLKATVDNGILSKLEANGVDLETIEKLLPVAEELGVLSLVGGNQQLLVNLVAPLLVEGAPILLPVVAGALGGGPQAFYLGAAGFASIEAFLLVNDVEIPFVGLPAGVLLGLILVPLSVVSAGVGVTLAGLKK